MAIKEQKTFRFPNIVNLDTGKTELVSSQVSISTCLALLLRTSPGELFGDPGFGSRLTEYLFDPNRELLRDVIQDEVYAVVSRYEPRAELTGIDFEVPEEEPTKLKIKITYINKNTGLSEVFNDILDLNEDTETDFA